MSLILLEFYTLLFGLEYLCFWLSVAVCDNHQPYFCLQSLPQGNWKLQLCGEIIFSLMLGLSFTVTQQNKHLYS